MRRVILGIPVVCALLFTACSKSSPEPNGYSITVTPYFSNFAGMDSAQAYIRKDTSADLTKAWDQAVQAYSQGGVVKAYFHNLQPGTYLVYFTGKSNLGAPVSGTTITRLTYSEDIAILVK